MQGMYFFCRAGQAVHSPNHARGIVVMNGLRLLPVLVSFLLLGAHFLRTGPLAVAVACAALPLLLLLRRAWIPPLMQVLLTLAALEWLRTLYVLAAMRIAWGEPWGRMALILGGVALFTGLSALVFRNRALSARYRAIRGD
jgi:hypothetical protein